MRGCGGGVVVFTDAFESASKINQAGRQAGRQA